MFAIVTSNQKNMNEKKIIEMLLSHEDRLERIEKKMVTKAEFRLSLGTLDTLVGLVKKIDQELIMQTHGMQRLTRVIEIHDKALELNSFNSF